MAVASFYIANMYVKAIMSLNLKQEELIKLLGEIFSVLPYNLKVLEGEQISKIPASKECKNLLNILYVKKHLANLGLIFELLKKNTFAKFGMKEVLLTSFMDISQNEISELKQNLEQYFKAQVDLKLKTESNLLGGFTLFFNNFLIDNSKKSKIFKIKSCILK